MQQEFQKGVLDRQHTPPTFIVDTPDVSAAERFNVYTDAYRLRLIEALSADYPALKDCLGEKGFDTMGNAYVEASPSDQFSIRWFGRYLPRFLAETSPFIEQPDLKELASFEWALSEAFDSPESTPVGYERFIAIEPSKWPSLRLHFHPSLRLIDFNFNVPQIWQASNQKEPLPAFAVNKVLQFWVVWRQELKVLFRSLPAQEFFALETFMQGQCFAEVCEGLCEWLEEEQVATNAAGFLQAWVRDGWITDLEISNSVF